MSQICNFATWDKTALLPLRRKACCGFFRPKNSTALAGFEPTILGTRGQHANHNTTEVTSMKMKQIERSETLAFKLQTPVNNPEENIKYSDYAESLKLKKFLQFENGQMQNVFVILSKG
jgi:hypothetical protein